MSTRNELSEKNKYWIERHRYLELMHFCRQYPTWVKARFAIREMSDETAILVMRQNHRYASDPVAKKVEAMDYYTERIDMIEKAAKQTDEKLSSFIIRGVTKGVSYENQRLIYNIPCSKDEYYECYHRFFYILNKFRK